jgi:hypothetical protein
MDGIRWQITSSRSGTVNCLSCYKPFKSPDVKAVRICRHCKKDRERLGKLADHMTECHDVAIPSEAESEPSGDD